MDSTWTGQIAFDDPAKVIAAYLVGRKHSPDHSPAWEELVTIAFQQADYPTAEAFHQWLSDREASNLMPDYYNNFMYVTDASRHDPSPPFLSHAILASLTYFWSQIRLDLTPQNVILSRSKGTVTDEQTFTLSFPTAMVRAYIVIIQRQ